MMNNQLSIIPESMATPQPLWQSSLLDSDFLNRLAGKRVIFRRDFSREPILLPQSEALVEESAKATIREFCKSSRERIVAGIDSSCVLVGETEEGSIFAGRVATVYGSKSGVKSYIRAGPIIFYINYEWLSSRFGSSSSSSTFSSSIPKSKLRAIASDDSIAERFIRIYMERAAQLEALRSVDDAIVAADGGLQRSSLELKNYSLREVQRIAQENSNELVGISKSSNILEISSAKGILSSVKRGSVYIDITEIIRSVSDRIGSNRVVAAKFAPNSPVFRVDFSSTNFEDESQVLSDYRANDVFFRGYPETLRFAHHLSVFDPATISSIRSYLSRRYSLVEVPSDDMRATVLGKLV